VFTESGKSARVLSRFRPPLPIYTFSRHVSTYKQLAISYGVEAFYMDLSKDPVKNTKEALRILKKNQMIESGDRLIVIFGNNIGVPESNNTLSIVTVK
jgi:pyruvate kinase